jgi:hypothetical protein
MHAEFIFLGLRLHASLLTEDHTQFWLDSKLQFRVDGIYENPYQLHPSITLNHIPLCFNA